MSPESIFIENYIDVKSKRPKTFRGFARHTVLSSLSLLNPFQKAVLSKPRIQFIYIHHLFKDEEKNFRNLIEKLQQYHDFISYGEAVKKLLQDEIDKPYIAISLDDGFKNNKRMAEILDEFSIKACFFINPGIIEVNNYDSVKEYCASRLHFPAVEFLSWKDVEDLKKNGHEIGSHTMHHSNVAQMQVNELAEDMHECREILISKCGEAKHFAFPFGRFFHFSEAGKKACFEAGYESCASAERGCHVPVAGLKKEDLCIRRDHIILDWDYRHIEYFLINNAKHVSPSNNLFPYPK